MPISDVLLLILFLILSGLFSSAEIAFVTLNKARVENMVKKGGRFNKLIKKLKEDPQKLLIVILIGNNVVNIATSVLATSVAIQAFQNVSLGIVTGILTGLILIFGEIIPKTFAQQHAEVIAKISAYPLLFMEKILYPIVWILTLFIRGLSKLSGGKADLTITEEELLALIDIGKKEGTFAAQEKELIENVLEFSDKQVEAVMTMRADMEVLEDETTVEEAMIFCQHKPHTRIPVFHDQIDNVVGLLTIHTIVQLYMDDNLNTRKLKDVDLPEPLIVPSTRMISSLFLEFQAKRTHLAVVVDEQGSVIGLVTLEDILEEIVGEIEDERDTEEKIIKREGDHRMIVDGNISLEEVANVFRLDLPDGVEEHRSINYMILKKLKRFPNAGEKVEFLGMRAFVLKLDKRRIEEVRLEKIEEDNKKK